MATKPNDSTIFGFRAYPPFKLGQPRFPQDTFLGRWLHFNDVIDPRTLLVSKDELEKCIKLLDDYKKGNLPKTVTDEELWKAQKIKQATIHPDTGEKIFMPFRMAGFVPFGSPIVTGLLLPNPTLFQTVFWQWLNQSHNACVNYANRNATKPTSTTKFLQGYACAVTAAVSIAVGLSILVKKADKFKPATKLLVQKFIPFPAVAVASTCNVLFMRLDERNKGIEVYDSTGYRVGTSKIAATNALRDTAITRMVLPAPIFIIPPIVMTLLEKTALLKRYPRLHLPFNAITCTAAFGFALPIAIALFPQVSKVEAKNLEENIRLATNESVLFYNKGL